MDPKVRGLYKQLLHIGRNYPLGLPYFRNKLKTSFKKPTDPSEIDKKIKHGEFVFEELKALWFLKKYRTVDRLYRNKNGQPGQN